MEQTITQSPKVARSNTIPSSPSDREALKKMIDEVVNLRYIQDAHAQKIKDAKRAILDKFPITGKLMNTLIRFEYKNDGDTQVSEWDELAAAWEVLSGGEPNGGAG